MNHLKNVWAKQAGFWKDLFAYPEFKEHVEAFAALVAAAEREACAKVCEDNYFAFKALEAIRARGETK
jgi:hypothetical protein